jgi:hypothetical protein
LANEATWLLVTLAWLVISFQHSQLSANQEGAQCGDQPQKG